MLIFLLPDGTHKSVLAVFNRLTQASWQKPHVKKNYTLIRRSLSKGMRLANLTEPQVHLLTCHINSMAKELFDNFPPFDLMKNENQKSCLLHLANH